MRKKKKTKKNVDLGIKRLTAEQYWRWNSSIEKMGCDKIKEQLAISNFDKQKLMVQNQQLKVEKTITNIKSAQEATKESEEAYKKVKKELEECLGVSLDDCIVDLDTYEIRKL